MHHSGTTACSLAGCSLPQVGYRWLAAGWVGELRVPQHPKPFGSQGCLQIHARGSRGVGSATAESGVLKVIAQSGHLRKRLHP